MIIVSASKLRNNLFEYLDKVSAGETIVVKRHKKEIARLIGFGGSDWRNDMSIKPKIIVPPEELIQPLDDIWEDYR
ncbi:type II toxin-antitoxin system Phd/YefM family antitoxin [bacterium]|nr:type II toxin-antitoxin system Phd/YefM family antitoxin [bacterium]